jgi:hypothetical protein
LPWVLSLDYLLNAFSLKSDIVEIPGKLELIHHAFQKIESVSEFEPVPSQLNDALVGHHALAVTVYTTTGEKVYSRGAADFLRQLSTNVLYLARVKKPNCINGEMAPRPIMASQFQCPLMTSRTPP